MARAKTAAAPKKKAAKPVKALSRDSGKKKGGKSRAKDAADALWKLAEHPLVAELLAVGATAAVAAIADGAGKGKGKGKNKASSKAVKAAGKAAAAAIGARLISEFAEETPKKSAKPKSARS